VKPILPRRGSAIVTALRFRVLRHEGRPRERNPYTTDTSMIPARERAGQHVVDSSESGLSS